MNVAAIGGEELVEGELEGEGRGEVINTTNSYFKRLKIYSIYNVRLIDNMIIVQGWIYKIQTPSLWCESWASGFGGMEYSPIKGRSGPCPRENWKK
ncbi:hypothetical protein J6590_039066 [Homalodisca vitripennis]|nr:hypothetical protein J6590_039066 [Homalodisca vitripennis]